MPSREQHATYRTLLRLLTCPAITFCIPVMPGTSSPEALEEGKRKRGSWGSPEAIYLPLGSGIPEGHGMRSLGEGSQGFVRRREHSSRSDLQTRVPAKVWRGPQSEAISSCCIAGTRCPARVSNQVDVWVPSCLVNQRQAGNAFRDTPSPVHRVVHSMLDPVRDTTAQAHLIITVGAWSRPSLLWPATQRLVGTPARVA